VAARANDELRKSKTPADFPTGVFYLLDVERLDVQRLCSLHIHPAHATARSPVRVVIFLRRFRDHDFRREQQPATDAAFCSARRVTFAGSRMPASIMSPYSPVPAL